MQKKGGGLKMEFSLNNISYEKWINENRIKVMEYVKHNDVAFKDVQMTSRAYNTLRMNGKNYMSDIVLCSFNEIDRFDKINDTVANEIMMFKKNYLRNHKKALIAFVEHGVTSKTYVLNDKPTHKKKEFTKEKAGFVKPEIKVQTKRSSYYIKLLLADSKTREKIYEFIKIKNIEIVDFNISSRTYNALRRGEVRFLHEAIPYYPDRFNEFRNMGSKAIEEICSLIENYVFEQSEQVFAYVDNGTIPPDAVVKNNIEDITDPNKLTILELIDHPKFKDKAVRYLKQNNIPIQNMGLDPRVVNAFVRANILTFYDALSIYPYDLSKLKNIGEKSINQIKERMEYYISKMQNAVSSYCNDDVNSMYSYALMCDTVMSCFENVTFEGILPLQIEEKFPKEIEKSRIDECIDKLIENNKLKRYGGKLYRVYASVYSFIAISELAENEKEIILKKLSGLTFEAIGTEKGITRERARQLFEKNINKLRAEIRIKQGFCIFNEDYYEYLYSNYELGKDIWLNYLGVSEKTLGYLAGVFQRGKKSIECVMDDPNIDNTVKSKIQNYLNRNKLFIDGVLIEKQRSEVEDYALSKIARNELSFELFADLYNELLNKNGIMFDEKLYITPEVRNTRKNRLADSNYCLWKHGEKIRYYDIYAHDYEELLKTLNLESYKNIEISTLKFFNDYPTLMLKYDIRDQYELHNLLKKIVDVSKYNDMTFARQPMIKFGL